MVIVLNRQAHNRLQCRKKQLVIVPGATHLFEEAGALEQVAQVAADWFARNFVSVRSSQGSSFVKVSGAR
jgi:putative phosphoribosyl transferase